MSRKFLWPKFDLTYRLNGGPTNFAAATTAKQLIDCAFQEWQSKWRFTFTNQDTHSDIEIFFRDSLVGSGSGDSGRYVVKDPLGTASANYRPNVGWIGTIEFNDDVNWSDTSVGLNEKPDGTQNLQAVALHEIGHVLGLGHTENNNSIMYEYNSNRTELDDDTVYALKLHYAEKRHVLDRFASQAINFFGKGFKQ